ncbi:helix-turn-helix domain-containing protein [Virgibacillus halophilus]
MFKSIGTFQMKEKWNDEFYIFECGYEDVQPREPYQYEPIDYYLIHYITKGEGLFFIEDEVHHLKEKEGFIIPPHTKNNYYPLAGNPWSYRWIGFNGTLSQQFFQQCGFLTAPSAGTANYIYTFHDKDKMDELFANVYYYSDSGQHFAALGEAFHILNLLSKQHQEELRHRLTDAEKYVQHAVKLIHANYQNPAFSVEFLAEKVQIERSYLFRLFKKHLNISPKTYLVQTRLNKSTELLRKSSNAIEEIAYLVGFISASHFSRQFSKNKGMSPSAYRSRFFADRK